MPKRKSNDSHLPENKRAKLHRPIMRNVQTPTSEVRAPYTPVLSLANPKLFGKRKRVLDSQSDASEEPDTKRARRSSSPESPNMSLESWPSIGYNPCQEEPNPLEQFYIESHHKAWRIHEEYDSDTPADHQNPLPSPKPSDRDATDEDMTESDEWRFPSVGSTLNTPRLLSRKRLRRGDTRPSRKKQRQPLKKGKNENKQDHQNNDLQLNPNP